MNTEEFLDDQAKFLKEVFKVDLPKQNKLLFPNPHPDFHWGAVVPKSLTIEQVIGSYSDICPVWRWTNDNLDINTQSTRSAENGTYISLFRNGIEPEENYKNKSGKQVKTAGISGGTLLERLLLGRWYAWMTNGQHLDMINVTRCDGSRNFRGNIPVVYFDIRDGKLYVFWQDPEEADDRLRTREVRA